MSNEYRYETNDEEALKFLQGKFPNLMTRAVYQSIADIMNHISIIATTDYMMTSPGGGKSKKLGMRTTRLMRSIMDVQYFGEIKENVKMPPTSNKDSIREIAFNKTGIRAKIGSKVPYARIHEYGGVIKPKKKKWLAIPVNGASGSPLDWKEELFFVKVSDTLAYWVNSKRQARYVLKKTVVIPARPYLIPAMMDTAKEIPQIVERNLHRFFSDYLGGGDG